MKKILILVLTTALLSSCGNNKTPHTEDTESSSKSKPTKVLHVYYYDGFNTTLGDMTIAQLKTIFDSVALEGTIPFPDSAYYMPRERYKADKLLKHQRALCPSKTDLVIGFSGEDISVAVHGYDDWGIMGLGSAKLKSCVISTHRLKNKAHLKEDFNKLALHELGHCEGLPHCNHSETCIMRDANKQNLFPQLTEFCPSCNAHLINRGWHLQ